MKENTFDTIEVKVEVGIFECFGCSHDETGRPFGSLSGSHFHSPEIEGNDLFTPEYCKPPIGWLNIQAGSDSVHYCEDCAPKVRAILRKLPHHERKE